MRTRRAIDRLGGPRVGALPVVLLTLLAGCSPGGDADSSQQRSGLVPGRPTRTVTLPDGARITAELATTPEEVAQGLMFRSYLGDDEGMLFVFQEIAPRGFWMFNTLIPLDIIWIDSNKHIVEISEMTPPCGEMDPSECPSYGGTVDSGYVLELAAGRAVAHGLKVGDRLEF